MSIETDPHPFAVESAKEFGRSLAAHLGESDAAAQWLEKFNEDEFVCAFPELKEECQTSYHATLDSLFMSNIAEQMKAAFVVDDQTTADEAAHAQSQQDSWDTLLRSRSITPEEYHQQISLLQSMAPSLSQDIACLALESAVVAPYKRLRQDIRLAGILDAVESLPHRAKYFLDNLSANDDISPARALFYGYRLKQHGANISDEHFKTFKAHQSKRMDAIKEFQASVKPCQMKSIMPGLAPTYEKIQLRQKRLEENVLAYTRLYHHRIHKKSPSKEDVYGYSYCCMESYVQGHLSLAQAQRNVDRAAALQDGQFELDARLGAADSIIGHALYPDLQKQTTLSHARVLFKASPDANSSEHLIDSLSDSFFAGHMSSAVYMREVDTVAHTSVLGEGDVYKRAGGYLRARGCNNLVKRLDLISKRSELKQTLNTPELKLDARLKREVASFAIDVAGAEAAGSLEPWEARAFLKETLGNDKRRVHSVLGSIITAGFPGVPALNANGVRNSYRDALYRLDSSTSHRDFVENYFGSTTFEDHLNTLRADIQSTCESLEVE